MTAFRVPTEDDGTGGGSMIGFRFYPTSPPRVLYPAPANGDERILNDIFGSRKCTVCGRDGATVVVVRGDGEWDGATVCGGEAPCVTTAMARYRHDDTEPWDDRHKEDYYQ